MLSLSVSNAQTSAHSSDFSSLFIHQKILLFSDLSYQLKNALFLSRLLTFWPVLSYRLSYIKIPDTVKELHTYGRSERWNEEVNFGSEQKLRNGLQPFPIKKKGSDKVLVKHCETCWRTICTGLISHPQGTLIPWSWSVRGIAAKRYSTHLLIRYKNTYVWLHFLSEVTWLNQL